MLEREGDAELVRLDRWSPIVGAANEMETREILGVVFDAAQQDVGAVLLGGKLRRETGSVRQRLVHDVHHASRGVVKGQSAGLGETGEELAALIQCDGMREHGADRGKLNARRGDEVMANLQQAFGIDANAVG